MKLKITPLIIVAAGLALFGLYCCFFGGNLGPLVGIVVIIFAALCLAPHYLLKNIIKATYKTQIFTELGLIAVVCFFIYKINGKIILQAHNYSGYVYIVYGVDKKPKLPSAGLFDHNIYLSIPSNGVFLTSSKPTNGYMNTLAVADDRQNKAKLLLPGYDIGYAMDTVKCGAKNYRADMLFLGKPPVNWKYRADTQKRDSIKAQICKMMGN